MHGVSGGAPVHSRSALCLCLYPCCRPKGVGGRGYKVERGQSNEITLTSCSWPFSGAVETDEPAGGGIFGGANTYQDSSEVASIEDSKERLASFRKIREAAERAGSAEQRYSARLTAPAEMKDPSDIEDARARLDEFRAMRAAATRILHAGV